MKKMFFVAAAAFVGISAAVAGNSRAVFEYVNLDNSGNYTLVSSFSAGKCLDASTTTCHYTLTAVSPIPSPATPSDLTAAGAVASSTIKKYRP